MWKAFLLLLLVILQAHSEERLIQFNASYSVWIPIEDVEKHTHECGGEGYMDITDYQVISLNKVSVTYPDKPTQEAIVEPLLKEVQAQRLKETVIDFSNFFTRYYTTSTGVDAAKWLAQEYSDIAIGKSNVEVLLFTNSWPQPSVIARILGTGPHATEVVILGGHIDSTVSTNPSTSRAPGADDDASGSATALEVFRVLVESGFRPGRTLEFHGYAAEEVGLRGSQAIANQYASRGIVVYGMLNMDMTGYVKNGTTPTIGLVSDFTDPELNEFIRKIGDAYISTPIEYTECGYACSDHASFTRAKYPAACVSESIFAYSNPTRHTDNDVVNILDFDHAAEIAKLALGCAVELSNAE